MAFLQKLITSRRFGRQNSRKNSSSDLKTDWKKPQFSDKAVRLVLFTDDSKGRKLIFDSKAVIREEEKASCGRGRWGCRGQQKLTAVKEGNVLSHPTNAKGSPVYQLQRTGSDSKMLEEMMFGSEGVAYKGRSLKVHVIRSPPQLMLTKVFIPEKPKRSSVTDIEIACSFSSAPDLTAPRAISQDSKDSFGVAQSVPMDVPSPHAGLVASIDLLDGDSGLASLTSSGSFHGAYPSPGSTASSSSSLSRDRRVWRGHSTSLESFSRRMSQNDVLANDIASPARHRRSKLAVGIIFGTIDENNVEANRQFENFFFSHIALFEGHLDRLRLAVEKAFYTGRPHLFLTGMIDAFDSFQQEIVDLYTAPRLSEPVWLNIMSYSNYRYMLYEKFLAEFMGLVTKYDNKSTNFFMSTVVTAVLTHHLAWVPTVMPAGGSPSTSYLDKHSAKWVHTLAKSHPYNPLWAQLGDLYGAIGFPLKLSRTVVIGRKAELVKKFLYVLSYFIRCSDVLEAADWGSLDAYMKSLQFVETPNDCDKSIISSADTPTNSESSSFKCVPQSPLSLTEEPRSLTINSLLNKDASLNTSSFTDSEGPNAMVTDYNSNNRTIVDNQPCADCGGTRDGQFSEKVGQSVFYVDAAGSPCTCDRPGTARGCSQPDPVEKANLEKGQAGDMARRRGSLRLHLSCNESQREAHCDKDNHSIADEVTPTPSQYQDSAECRLSFAQVIEDAKVQNVKHVRKSVDHDKVSSPSNGLFSGGVDIVVAKNSSNLKNKSKLTLKFCNNGSLNGEKLLSKDEIKSLFLKEGSDSMFNEYFDVEGIETKTIDDVDEKDRVVELPVLGKHRFHSGDNNLVEDSSHKAPSLPDLSRVPADGGQSKGEGDRCHRVRLGSLDHTTFRSRKPSFTRQLSDMKAAPGRCRPITPTELSRRRHVSSTSSFDFDFLDPSAYCKELPMPECGNAECTSQKAFDKNFGRSLLADFSDHYMSDFVLHGTSDRNYQEKLMKDVHMASQYSVLDEPIAEAVCIVADTDQWTVNICSNQSMDKTVNGQQPCLSSHLVHSLIESVLNMYKLRMSPEFCMMHLEDRLQEIYFKSKLMAEYLKGNKKKDIKELLAMFGFDRSDLPLLVAIAGTHTPNFPLIIV